MVVSTDDKGQTAFSDSYFKRKNQLVRHTFENHTVAMPNNIGNSDVQGASRVLCNWRFTKRRSHKVAGLSSKSSRASLVWTLSSKILLEMIGARGIIKVYMEEDNIFKKLHS